MKNSAWRLIFLMAFLTCRQVSGQTIDPHGDSPIDTAITEVRLPNVSTAAEKVYRLLFLGQFDRAADLAESELAKIPDDIHLKDLLGRCYAGKKDFRKLILLLQRRIADERPQFQLFRDLGWAYLQTGNKDTAIGHIYQAARLSDFNPNHLLDLAGCLQYFGYYSDASTFIDSMRMLTGESRLLPGQKGDALAAQKRYAEATYEYLVYMEQDSVSAAEAESRIISMIQYQESTDTVMAILAREIPARLNFRQLVNTYGQILMEQERYSQAGDYFFMIDSMNNRSGSDILYFLRECNRRGAPNEVLAAGQRIIETNPPSPVIGGIIMEIAAAFTALGEIDSALARYQATAAMFTRPSQQVEAMVNIAALYKDYLNNCDSAQRYFDIVISAAPQSRYAARARLGLADVYIRRHLFDSALAQYTLLAEMNPAEEIGEEIDFREGMANLFWGKYAEADIKFKQVISRYPYGLYVNDAVEHTLVLGEVMNSAPGQIDLLAASEYYRYTGRDDSLEYYLDKICRIGIPALAPVSYLRLIELYQRTQRPEDALAAADRLAAEYPQSYFVPYGLKLKADILYRQETTRGEAEEIYRRLLQEYPTYPFTAAIRSILRQGTDTDRSQTPDREPPGIGTVGSTHH